MRSKEEALAKPLAGDRWGMGGNEFIIRKFAQRPPVWKLRLLGKCRACGFSHGAEKALLMAPARAAREKL